MIPGIPMELEEVQYQVRKTGKCDTRRRWTFKVGFASISIFLVFAFNICKMYVSFSL